MVERTNGLFVEDQDQLFLDTIIALALDIVQHSDTIIDLSDEPEVLTETIKSRDTARSIQGKARTYRARLKQLKTIERSR